MLCCGILRLCLFNKFLDTLAAASRVLSFHLWLILALSLKLCPKRPAFPSLYTVNEGTDVLWALFNKTTGCGHATRDMDQQPRYEPVTNIKWIWSIFLYEPRDYGVSILGQVHLDFFGDFGSTIIYMSVYRLSTSGCGWTGCITESRHFYRWIFFNPFGPHAYT